MMKIRAIAQLPFAASPPQESKASGEYRQAEVGALAVREWRRLTASGPSPHPAVLDEWLGAIRICRERAALARA